MIFLHYINGTAILEVISFGEQMRSPGVEIVTDYTLFFMCHVRSLALGINEQLKFAAITSGINSNLGLD
jgi:hypothetical protein